MSLETNFPPNFFTFTVKNVIFKNLVTSHEILKSGLNVNLKGHGCLEIKFIIQIDDFIYHEGIFYPFLPMFSTFDVKMVNVVENAECFSKWIIIYFAVLGHRYLCKVQVFFYIIFRIFWIETVTLTCTENPKHVCNKM